MTPIQILECVNNWLEAKGESPLSCDEIVTVVSKMMGVTDRASTVEGLKVDLAVATSIAVCKLRGMGYPRAY